MDGKTTRLQKQKRLSMMGDDGGNSANRDANNDFTYDHSYWSHLSTDTNFATQEQVYEDLGSDVINSAFQGKNIVYTIILLIRPTVCVMLYETRAIS